MRSRTASAAPKSLRVSEVVIVDPQGVERVRIGGDVPDTVIGGKRTPRGAKAAGVLLYDGTGQERGGYVTWEPAANNGLTLDTKLGQAALFGADPDSGTALRLWHGKDLIELRSDQDGSRLTAVKAGRVVAQQPDVSIGTEAYKAYKEAESRLLREQVLNECQHRFSDTACRVCLGEF